MNNFCLTVHEIFIPLSSGMGPAVQGRRLEQKILISINNNEQLWIYKLSKIALPYASFKQG
jgi:hypothetical protein